MNNIHILCMECPFGGNECGGHRILDAENVAHYIPYKWIHLYWETKDEIAIRF